MKILITDKVDSLLIHELEKNKLSYQFMLNETKEEILNQINQFNGIIVRNRLKLDASFLKKCKHLKFIARYGSGMENIDLTKAKELDITCFNSASGNCNSVGEHAIGMLLCLLHNIKKSSIQVDNGFWNRELNKGIELCKKKVGIIGYGHTGQNFAKKLIGFNCQILAYDKYKSRYNSPNIKEVNLEQIYQQSDIISFHVPLNKETFHLFNQQFINNMHKPFYLINTSRGGVVSNNDLIRGLKSEKILGACLDVIENEVSSFRKIKLDSNFDFLANCDNVIMTPHIAGLSNEASENLSLILIEKILELI